MTYYLFQGRFTREAMKALVDNPQDRAGAASQIIENADGKMHHYFFAFGSHDVVILAEYPENVDAAAVGLAVCGAGALESSETTVLLTMDEAVAAMKKANAIASAYRPPQA
jgi:uncharacterized protein with GYD domain